MRAEEVTNGAIAVGPSSARTASEADAFYAIPTRLDRIGRIVVPVKVNGQGPFPFVLDTGANATVVSPHLAAILGLKIDTDQPFIMNGVTGSSSVPTAEIETVAAREVVLERQRLAVSDASGVGTDGVLGTDALQGKAVLVDFNNDRVEVYSAGKRHPSESLVRVAAKLRLGNLLIIDAAVSTHKIKAVIDTGGQRTLGNPALYKMLGFKREVDSRADVYGATNARQDGERHVVHRIKLSESMSVANLVVTFGDFYIFKLWGLESQPALVIGMDMIGTLGEFGVDYSRREVQLNADHFTRLTRRPRASGDDK